MKIMGIVNIWEAQDFRAVVWGVLNWWLALSDDCRRAYCEPQEPKILYLNGYTTLEHAWKIQSRFEHFLEPYVLILLCKGFFFLTFTYLMSPHYAWQTGVENLGICLFLQHAESTLHDPMVHFFAILKFQWYQKWNKHNL